MKKICLLLMLMLIVIPKVEAKTLQDLKNELAKFEADYKANQNKENLTNAEKAAIKANIQNIQITITEIGDTMVKLNEEIVELEGNIVKKQEQIKKIANFIQVSNGESAYLEYTFGAKDFTDFIYRLAVAEQLSNYNKKLISDYNELIDGKEQRKVELDKKEKSLEAKEADLEKELAHLNMETEKIYEIYGTLNDAIKKQKDIIANLEAKGCKLNENIETCGDTSRDTRFYRPLTYGWVTSPFGMRWHPTKNKWLNHDGIDLSTGTYGNPVYAAANGTVVAIEWKKSCGGNKVYIIHNVNGKKYTTAYFHLYQVKVTEGQKVTNRDVIGTVGGASWLTPWDGCSTGAHLHFSILTGWAGYDYIIWDSKFYASQRDPASYISFPSYFEGRG